MRRLARLVATLALSLSPAVARPADDAAPRTVSVAAAASLRSVVADLARAFEAETPRARVRVTLGASGALFAQVRNGAPFDAFLSADRDLPRRLVEARLGGPEVVYAVGRLVIWTPRGSSWSFERTGVAGLANRGIERIAIANPAVAPYGRAAVAALQSAGILKAVEGRLVLGESVAQAAQFADSGSADAALLPASLAADPPLSSGRAVLVPQALHPRLEQSGLVLASAREPALARAFLDFVAGRRGREILLAHRYELP